MSNISLGNNTIYDYTVNENGDEFCYDVLAALSSVTGEYSSTLYDMYCDCVEANLRCLTMNSFLDDPNNSLLWAYYSALASTVECYFSPDVYEYECEYFINDYCSQFAINAPWDEQIDILGLEEAKEVFEALKAYQDNKETEEEED